MVKSGNIPLYFQFYLTLKNEIMLGDRKAGERIPTIEELQEQYGVSQITIRKALDLLEQSGVINKKQQKGIFVNEDISRLMLIHSKSHQDEIEQAKSLDCWTLSSDWMDAPPRFNRIFEHTPGTHRNGRIFIIKRLWMSKTKPWWRRLSTIFVPAFLYDKIAPYGEKDFIVLEEINKLEEFRQQKIRTSEALHPWICDAESAEYLGIPDGTPLFLRIFTHYKNSGEPLWRSESLSTAFTLALSTEITSDDSKTY